MNEKFFSLNQLPLYTDDFSFTSSNDLKVKDTIVINNPSDAICISPVFLRSRKTLEEHIQYIQEHQMKKAVIIAEDISFLPQCPSLEHLRIIPAVSAEDFDYSPLYEMPNIKWLLCETIYGRKEEKYAHVDYSKIQGIQSLYVCGAKGHDRLIESKGIKSLCFEFGQPSCGTLKTAFDGTLLENLIINQSPIRSLEGLEDTKRLKRLELVYNRRLEDISALSAVKESLIWLRIEKCGKIRDFSVLSELHNLEYLTLIGSNRLPNLSFLENMRQLQSFIISMNVEDGDLSMCERIPYVNIQNRKHYSHKNDDFSKKYSFTGDISDYIEY